MGVMYAQRASKSGGATTFTVAAASIFGIVILALSCALMYVILHSGPSS